jgi:CheY-like chemotaxis protein
MSAIRRILIIEDDAALRATMAEQILSGGEFSADEAESAAAAEALLANSNTRYDAILLDIGLPDLNGRDFCAKLRRDGRQMPVIMVTGADAEGDVVRGSQPSPMPSNAARLARRLMEPCSCQARSAGPKRGLANSFARSSGEDRPKHQAAISRKTVVGISGRMAPITASPRLK